MAWNDEDRKKFLEFIESDEYKNFILKMKIYEILKDVVPINKKKVRTINHYTNFLTRKKVGPKRK